MSHHRLITSHAPYIQHVQTRCNRVPMSTPSVLSTDITFVAQLENPKTLISRLRTFERSHDRTSYKCDIETSSRLGCLECVLLGAHFNEDFFHHYSNPIEIAFCSLLICSGVIVTKFCTWLCVTFCNDRIAWHFVTLKPNFRRIWITTKRVVKQALLENMCFSEFICDFTKFRPEKPSFGNLFLQVFMCVYWIGFLRMWR